MYKFQLLDILSSITQVSSFLSLKEVQKYGIKEQKDSIVMFLSPPSRCFAVSESWKDSKHWSEEVPVFETI